MRRERRDRRERGERGAEEEEEDGIKAYTFMLSSLDFRKK